jgi:hypothetical protein
MVAFVAMSIACVGYLRWQGRIWYCAQGDIQLFSFNVNSPHNSQHLFDAYAFSHVLHGVIFFGALWFTRKKLSLPWRFFLACAIEWAWECLENSPIIINRYRAVTVSLGYEGDSIVNSFGDIVSCALGFSIARWLGLWKSIALFVLVELALLLWIRDNLTLNVLMLTYPIEAVRKWQAGG